MKRVGCVIAVAVATILAGCKVAEVKRGDEIGQRLRLHLVHRLALHELALHREERVARIGDRLALGDLADEALAARREADDGRSRPPALAGGDDPGLPAFHHGDAAVGRAEIDSDDLCHS